MERFSPSLGPYRRGVRPSRRGSREASASSLTPPCWSYQMLQSSRAPGDRGRQGCQGIPGVQQYLQRPPEQEACPTTLIMDRAGLPVCWLPASVPQRTATFPFP